MKRNIVVIIISIIVSFLLVFLKGNENTEIAQSCYSQNSVRLYANESLTYDESDLNKLKSVIDKNNWIYVAQIINKDRYDLNYIYYDKKTKNESRFLKCVNYFEDYKNDFLNWNDNLIFSHKKIDFSTIRLFDIFSQNITTKMVKDELIKNNLDKKFFIDENLIYENSQIDNTYYDLLITSIIILSISLFYIDFYRLIKSKKEYMLLNSFGYKDVFILLQLLINERVKQFINIFILTFLLLLIYYRAFNSTFFLLFMVLIALFSILVFTSVVVIKIVALLNKKNSYYIYNIFLIIVFLGVSLYSVSKIKNTVVLVGFNEGLADSKVKENYYNNSVALNATNKIRENVAKKLINNYDAFEVSVIDLENNREKIIASSKYLENTDLFDIHNKKIKFDKNKKCMLLISSDIFNQEADSTECKKVELRDNQKFLKYQAYPEYAYGSILIEINNSNIINYNLMFKAKNKDNANKIINKLYLQDGIISDANSKSSSVMLDSSISYGSLSMAQYTLLVLINIFSLLNLNLVLSYLIYKTNLKSIFLKYSFGYSSIKVMSSILLLYALIYSIILVYSIIVFGIIALPIILVLISLSLLIIYFSIYKNLKNEFIKNLKGDV